LININRKGKKKEKRNLDILRENRQERKAKEEGEEKREKLEGK